MTDEKPTQSDATAEPGSDNSMHLSGLTEVIGGLDPAVPDHDPLIGTVVGGVTIVRPIAEGGMGRVYEGLQEKPRRPVAVKVMRPGFVSREACRRFDNESEVLGRLRHPYIAQIYSAGICTIVGAPVPYFVMELIPDALPITKYATAKNLSTNERIELFRKVCEAVAHGHEKKVIHRDLKPRNILVEPNGVPKIIDFGIARCVDTSPEAMTALTDMGQLIGTVQYMSPEQFSADPTNVDVRADVYALGVILYELLANRPPYEIRQKEIFEAARVVRECKPASPAKFNSNLSADVVKITGTCLQKDRRRRYANAVELQGALADYLGGKPVPDRNPSWLGSVITHARDWAGTIPVRLTVGLALAGLVATLGAWLLWVALASPISPPEPQLSFQFNGHSYRIVLEPVTRAEAARKCEEQGGHLARITTETENKSIFAATAAAGLKGGRLWIEGGRRGEDSEWAFDDKREISFFYRGRNRLDVDPDAPSHALAIAVDAPVAYWAALNDAARADGFVCEWDH
jgi:hypothetical protein